MSGRAKNLLVRILDRLMDGPKCPKCDHGSDIHYEDKCLGAVYDKSTGVHIRWCDCANLR